MRNGWYEENGFLNHYLNDKWHNEKGPAIIVDNGTKYWIQNGKDHRIDGPAVEWNNGDKYWFYQGEIINCQSQAEFERYLKLKSLW